MPSTAAPSIPKYGPVQVQAQVVNGVLTDVAVLRYATRDNKSVRIDARALPTLRTEVITAHSASIHTVSGAPYTSDGYARSCMELTELTDGCFDAFAVPAPNGTVLDPSGYVKGWAIEQAAAMLSRRCSESVHQRRWRRRAARRARARALPTVADRGPSPQPARSSSARRLSPRSRCDRHLGDI